MSVLGWVASHTGMPSFRLEGAGRLTTDGRLVAASAGDTLFVSDPAAEIGSPTVYEFQGETVSLTRVNPFGDGFLVTDFWGRRAVNVDVGGHDPMVWDPRVSLADGQGSFPHVRYEGSALSPTGSLEWSTTGDSTAVMRGLLGVRAPVWVVHNETSCRIPDCDFGASRLVQPVRVSDARSPRVDRAYRDWLVEYRTLDRGVSVGAGVVTWGEWEAAAPDGWADVSYAELCSVIAGML